MTHPRDATIDQLHSTFYDPQTDNNLRASCFDEMRRRLREREAEVARLTKERDEAKQSALSSSEERREHRKAAQERDAAVASEKRLRSGFSNGLTPEEMAQDQPKPPPASDQNPDCEAGTCGCTVTPPAKKPGDVWECQIGYAGNVPHGGDSPMRRAVADAFENLTGERPEFIFSGWGSRLAEARLAVVENRLPDREVLIREAEANLAIVNPAQDQPKPPPADEPALARLRITYFAHEAHALLTSAILELARRPR